MKELSASDVTRLTRKLRQLQRSNGRLRADLRDARRTLLRLLVRREGDGELIRGSFTRRAAQYALLMTRGLEGAAERKRSYYAGLLENPQALVGTSAAAVAVHILRPSSGKSERHPTRNPIGLLRDHLTRMGTSSTPARAHWRSSALAVWRRAMSLLRPSTGGRRTYWWSHHFHLVPNRAEALVQRALEVAQAFELLAGRAGREGQGLALDGSDHPWALEGVRQEIIRGAGSRFDPLMVEALVAAWSEIVSFYRSRKAA